MKFNRHLSEDTLHGPAKDAVERMILSRGYKVGDQLPTYRELAEHLGITTRTVGRVMHQLAEEGLVQLRHGKGVFVKRLPAGGCQLTKIGVVCPTASSHLVRTSYLNQILSGIIQECDQQQIDLHIDLRIVSSRATHEPVPPRTLALRADAIVLLEVVNERYIAEFAREPIPMVLVDAQTGAAPIPSVCVDNAAAVEQVMNHLYALGHRRIAYLDTCSYDNLARGKEPICVDPADARERRKAYENALQQLGLSYHSIYLSPSNLDVPSVMASLIADVNRKSAAPTAVLCAGDLWADKLCRQATAAGLRVPQDLSVAAAVGSQGSHVGGSHVITCAMAAFDQMGRLAVQALLRQAAGRTDRASHVERVPSQLEIGTTTAPTYR